MAEGFSREELLRYSRHTILPEIGVDGQRRLKEARVVLIGAGGLGSPAALYLAAAGVGTLGIVDFDVVDASNLHRQVIHGTSKVGQKKLDSAAERLYDINPHVRVVKHETRLSSQNALQILNDYDLVIDGTDNFATRYLVNDACVLLKKPNVYGSILGFEGQATIFCAPDGPCYRCLYPEPPPPGLVPSCAEGGVLGVLPGIIGLIQATEAIKAIVGIGEPLQGRLLMYDALGMRFQEVRIRRDPNCPACGDRPTIDRLIGYDSLCGVTNVMNEEEIEPADLISMIQRGDDFDLLDVRTPAEFAVSRLPNTAFIPLAELPGRLQELDSSRTTVVYCRSGVRSAHACAALKAAGFRRPINLSGGILRWEEEGGAVES